MRLRAIRIRAPPLGPDGGLLAKGESALSFRNEASGSKGDRKVWLCKTV